MLTSALTDRLPRSGAWFLDKSLQSLLGNPWIEALLRERSLAVLERVKQLGKVLILPDIHLGDPLLMLGLVRAVRDFFPEAETHYVVARGVPPFLEGHPDISRLCPVYSSLISPSERERATVGELIAQGGYDLVVNLCSHFKPGSPLPERGRFLDFQYHAPHMLRNEMERAEPNHFLYQSHRFLADLCAQRWSPQRPYDVRGAQVFLGDEAVDEADGFLASVPGYRQQPLVLLNPDASSRFTRLPEAMLAALLERMVDGGAFVLVGEGHTEAGVGIRIRESLAPALQRRTLLVPAALSAPAFAALLDRMDVFVSGDTGPLHWGAARKASRTGRRSFRNRTAVYSLFGSTPPRLLGYASSGPGFLPAWQDAPSAVFLSQAPCRNATCLDKYYKTCRITRCFDGFPGLAAAEAVLARLAQG